METVNSVEVDTARAPLRAAVHGDPSILLEHWTQSMDPLPVARYRHVFRLVMDGRPTEQTWMVVTGLFRGPDNKLLKHAQAVCDRNEKVIPWAGAAAPLGVGGGIGGLACFLPLPESVDWPVLLHGWFDLNSSRRNITRQAESGEAVPIRAAWNRELLRYGAGPAYMELVEQLRGDAVTTTEPYRLWLRPSIVRDDYDRALVEGFYAEIGARQVFRHVGPGGMVWRSLEGRGDKCLDLGETWHEALREPLLASGCTLVEPPLPTFVNQALQKTLYPSQVLSADEMRASLQHLQHLVGNKDINCRVQDAPWAALRRPEWVTAIARFCTQEGLDRLAGLPLALLSDGRLHTFGRCGTLYLVSEAERVLLAAIPHRMLDPQFQQELRLTQPMPALGITRLDLPGLVSCVQEILSLGRVDEAWLVRLFDHLEHIAPNEVKKQKAVLETLRIVPADDGWLWPMGCLNTPVLLDHAPSALLVALSRLGLPLLVASEPLLASIRRFASRHPGFIWTLDQGRLATTLASHVETPWIRQEALADRAVVAAILDFLSPPNWLIRNDPRVDAIRKLVILPTTGSSIVSAETKNLYIPGGFNPPREIDVHHMLLDTGEEGRWVLLFKALRVPEWDGFNFIVSGLLPAFPHATLEIKLKMLRWLRDHLRAIEMQLTQERRQSLRSKVREAPIMPLKGGGMGAPQETYRPDAEDARKVLGDVANLPDLDLLGDDPKQWTVFFSDLELLGMPKPRHLLMAIERCMDDAGSQGVAPVRDRLNALREYIARRWDSLADPKKGGTQGFVEKLAVMAWLPAAAHSSEKVAAAVAWPARLFKASELAAPQLLHLVASVCPVLEAQVLPTEMIKALGLRTQVTLDEALHHFAAVRALKVDGVDSEVQKARKTAFVAFLQYVAELPEWKKPDWGTRLATMGDVPCALLRGMWWRPRQVYLESLPFATDWCVSLLEDPELAGRLHMAEGLTRLGARSKPTPSDWVEMLGEQHVRSLGRPLNDVELSQVRAALQQLRVQGREWLQSQPILLPTVDRQLLSAREALIPDDPRLKRLPCLCTLPLVEETEIALDVARGAGARSLQQVLVEELADEPTPSQDSELLRWVARRARIVRSPAFYEALRRLAWHEAVQRGEQDPSARANDEKLTLARRLTLSVARTLRVTSAFCDTGEIVFEQQSSSFWDHASATLWLSEGSKRKMGDDLARTLATECSLDALRLSRLLDAEPEDMASLLDEDNIAVIPTGGQVSLPPTWIAPDDLLGEQGVPDTYQNEREVVAERENEAPIAEGYEAIDGSEVGGIGRWRQGSNPGDGVHWRQRQGAPGRGTGGGGAGVRPHRWGEESSVSDGDETLAMTHAPEAPTTPGFGSSQPWSPNVPRAVHSGTSRLRSYVHREELSDYDTGSAKLELDHPVYREAVQRVREWESIRGRTAVDVSDTRPGYELESSGPGQVRLIKVKGIDGPWTARGVGLTRVELRKALELGPAWWLYVVENARESERAAVHDLRNPFLEAVEYRFDSGWRAISVAEEAAMRGPVEGEEITLEDGSRAMVVDVESRGRLWMVTIRFFNGNEEKRVWRSSWRRS